MGITNCSWKNIQRGYSVNYLGYKISLQKLDPKRCKLEEINWLQTLNDFQRLLGDISQLHHTIGIGADEMMNLNKTLDVDKDLNNPRELLALIEEKLQKAYVDHVDQNLNCSLVISPFKYSLTGF